PQEQHANIRQTLFWADNPQHKRKLLDHWLRDTKINQAIVFASTQIECDALAGDLQQVGFSAVALHGALSQGLRNRRLTALRQGQVQILVATDVAARGIDVPTITHVFNFGLPMKAEDYTHRIGRTGRAGRDGLAVSFAEFRDRRRIFDIEAFTRQPFKAEVIPGLEPQQRPPTAGRGSFGGGERDRGGDRFARGGPPGARAGGGGYASRGRSGPSGPRGGNDRGGFGGDRGGFAGDRGGYAGDRGGFTGDRGSNAGDRGHFGGDRGGFSGDRGDFGQPRGRDLAREFGDRPQRANTARPGDFAARAAAPARGEFVERHSAGARFERPAKPSTGKVFVPRDAGKKRAARPSR
ncbi:MAG: helicase-related protein, partial [Burkholderiales bacterium]